MMKFRFNKDPGKTRVNALLPWRRRISPALSARSPDDVVAEVIRDIKVPDQISAELVPFIPARHRQRRSSDFRTVAPELPRFDAGRHEEAFLTELAVLFRGMPYGSMIEFCDATGVKPQQVWGWANEFRKAA